MKFRIVFALAILIASVAIASAKTESGDIPITTSSKEARDFFNNGLHAMDVARPLEARTALRKAVETDPSFTQAYFYLSMTALSPEEFKQTLDHGIKSLSGKSDGENMLMQIAQTFINNDAAKAIEVSQKLVAEYPNGPRAWMRLGFAQGAVNHNEEARKAWSRALQLDPSLVGAHYALAFSYLFGEPKDFQKAGEHANACTKLEPKEAKGFEMVGDVYRAKNELEKARDAYTKATTIDPALGTATMKKGHIDSFLGRYDEARGDYDKGMEGIAVENKIAYANFKALTWVHAGEPEAALQELQKLVAMADSIGISKDQAVAAKLATLNNELLVAFHYKRIADAESILEQIRTLTNESISGVKDADFERLQKANLLILEGQLSAYKGDYKTAVSKAEENRKMVENDSNPRKLEGYYGVLGLVERLQGNNSKAVEDYRKADLTVLYNKYQLGLALKGAGNDAEAKKIMREVSTWNFNTVDFALTRKDAAKMGA